LSNAVDTELLVERCRVSTVSEENVENIDRRAGDERELRDVACASTLNRCARSRCHSQMQHTPFKSNEDRRSLMDTTHAHTHTEETIC
jgi:hypothetical protein